METAVKNQWTISEQSTDTHLLTWVEAFQFDRKAQGFSKGTLYFYEKKLGLFSQYCEGQAIQHITQIAPQTLREFLVWLEQRGHNSGGIHTFYRAVKTFLLWWEDELEPEDWQNPIRKVKAPKLTIEPIQGIKLDNFQAMLGKCESKRDKAILICLLDTGARASEFCSMDLEDLDRVYGSILIQQGKGKKPRTVFLGKKARRVLRAYLRERKDSSKALWVTRSGERLTYWGLRQIIRRKAKDANISTPRLHDFRRAFALECLRNGANVYSLQKLMGHADLQVLRRYLAQTTNDIRVAHEQSSPVDNFLN